MAKDNLAFISLSIILKDKPISKSSIKNLIKNFKSRNTDVQYYLNTLALEDENQPNQRTFFIMNERMTEIYFYFHLVLKTTSTIGISEEVRKGIMVDARKTSAQMMLIAQIGKNTVSCPEKVNTMLIWDYIYEAMSKWPAKLEVIKVECDDQNKKLISYYEAQGFTQTEKDDINNLVGFHKKYVY